MVQMEQYCFGDGRTRVGYAPRGLRSRAPPAALWIRDRVPGARSASALSFSTISRTSASTRRQESAVLPRIDASEATVAPLAHLDPDVDGSG